MGVSAQLNPKCGGTSMENEDDIIWPLVILVVAFLLYQAEKTQAATNLATVQSNIAAQQAAQNSPLTYLTTGVGALGTVMKSLNNLFSSNSGYTSGTVSQTPISLGYTGTNSGYYSS
jgi:hypothetical protein